MIYIFMTIGAVFFAKLSQLVSKCKVQPKSLKTPIVFLLAFMAFFVICFPAAVRVGVGTDYWSYVLLYNNYTSPIFEYMGPLFIKFIALLHIISDDPRFFFIISSTIIYGCLTWSFFKESEDAALSLLLFIIMEDYFVSMNVVRQYMDIAFLAPAYIALEKNKKLLFIVIVIMASIIFHTSGLIALGLLFFTIKQKKRFQWLINDLILFGSTVVLVPTIKYVIIAYTEYGHYFSSSYADEVFSVAGPLLLIYITLFVVALLLCSEESLLNNNRIKIFLAAVTFNIIALILSFVLTQNTYRLSYVFNIAIAMYFPDVLADIDRRNHLLQLTIKSAAIILFSTWTILLLLHNNQNALPYYSIFT